MLTAWDNVRHLTLTLPDYESRQEIEELRERTRLAELVCPECDQPLWLRAGDVVVWHFAHRRLSDCPLSRVSREVLCARRLVYRFFQSRIASGKLPAEIQLEPVIAGLPEKVRLDLLLRRADKPAVAVLLLDKGLRPDVRMALPAVLKEHQFLLRPVFLGSRLKWVEPHNNAILLDPTQREWRLKSPYDLPHGGRRTPPGTLHFLDADAETWITLRALSLVHPPQVYAPTKRLASSLDQLLWRESHAEWVHPGEAETLKQFLDHLKKEQALKAEQARHAEQVRRQAEARQTALAALETKPLPNPFPQPKMAGTPPPVGRSRPRPRSLPKPKPEPEPLPAWIQGGLVCIGCGQRTTRWQNAKPAADQCVCPDCFAAGVRLR